MREGKNGETQQIFIERSGKTDQQVTQEKNKIYQNNIRKEKTVGEDKNSEKIEGDRYQKRRKYKKQKQKT